MGVTFFCMIAGIIFGLLCSLAIEVVSEKRSVALWVINSVAGALGAVAVNQLLVWGSFILGAIIIPAVVDAAVLAIVGTYGFTKVRDHCAQQLVK